MNLLKNRMFFFKTPFMKSIFLTFIFFHLTTIAIAQYDYGDNNAAVIKEKKVKTMYVYYFKNELDSALTHIISYDTLGSQLNTKRYSSYGSIFGSMVTTDTFIYNHKYLLIKQIIFEHGRISETYTYNYNEDDKLIAQTIKSDSINIESKTKNTYDADGRLVKSIGYFNNLDTFYFFHTYNRKGLRIKTVSFTNNTQRSVSKYEYNSLGKVIKSKSHSPESEDVSELKYDASGNIYERVTISINNKRKWVTKLIFSYNSNGLVFEKFVYYNKKPSGFERFYYTYY